MKLRYHLVVVYCMNYIVDIALACGKTFAWFWLDGGHKFKQMYFNIAQNGRNMPQMAPATKWQKHATNGPCHNMPSTCHKWLVYQYVHKHLLAIGLFCSSLPSCCLYWLPMLATHSSTFFLVLLYGLLASIPLARSFCKTWKMAPSWAGTMATTKPLFIGLDPSMRNSTSWPPTGSVTMSGKCTLFTFLAGGPSWSWPAPWKTASWSSSCWYLSFLWSNSSWYLGMLAMDTYLPPMVPWLSMCTSGLLVVFSFKNGLPSWWVTKSSGSTSLWPWESMAMHWDSVGTGTPSSPWSCSAMLQGWNGASKLGAKVGLCQQLSSQTKVGMCQHDFQTKHIWSRL